MENVARYFSWSYIKEKWNHDGFQKYFQNTGWMFVSKVLSMGLSFFATIIVVRRLGPINFGQLSYATSFITIFSVLAGFGIDNVLYRELVNNPDKKKEYLGSALAIKLVTGILATILVIIFASFFAQDDVSRTLIFILSGTFIFSAFQIINYEFQARVQSKYPSIIGFAITLILDALEIIVVLSGKGVIYLAYITLLGSILYAVFYWYFYEKKIEGRLFDWKFDKQITITLLKDSWPLIFTSAFMLVYGRIDQVFIKSMIDAKAVGIYGAAVTIAEIWYFIPGIIISSIFPSIISAKKISTEKYHARLKKLTILLFILAVAISIPVTIFAPLIIHILYGPAFAGGSIILQIYVWASIGIFVGASIDNYLITENHTKILIFRTFVPMVINIALNLWWIPKYGIVGSAYATLISYSLVPISILLLKNTREDMRKIFFTQI